MSRHAPRCLTLALAAAAVLMAPGAAWGQQTEQELIQHLDSLMPIIKEARAEAEAARQAHLREIDAKQPTEKLVIGLLHVLVPPGQAEPAQDVIGTVWERDYAALVDRSPSLDRDQIFFQWAVNLQPYNAASFRIRAVDGRRWRSRAYMETRAGDVISESLKGDLTGTRFQEGWGIAGVRPPRNPQDLYRRFVVTPSVAVRHCLEGDSEACLVALGLRDDGYRIDDWYTPEEQRLLVVRQETRFGRQAESRQACLEGSLEACDTTLRDYAERQDQTLWASPVDPEVHSSMLWYALQQGGAGAWGRLLEHADDDPVVALEAVSGMDGHALAAGWHAWLLESRPEARAGFGSLTLGTLFWILLLITFAARSTRWRLG